MPWYYANNDQRLGPVSDTEFARLARDKIIHDDTLVWQHGMPDWKTYAEVAPKLPTSELYPPPIPGIPRESGSTSTPDAAAILTAQPVRLSYAGFWVRFAAKLVDWLILYAISRLLARLMGLAELDPFELLQGNAAVVGPLAQRIIWLGFLDSVARLVFYWFFLKRFAATPGKMLFGLKVVSSDGSPLSHGQVVGRFFAEVLTKYFTLCIGYVVAAFDDEKRTMQDHFCNTRVIKKQRS